LGQYGEGYLSASSTAWVEIAYSGAMQEYIYNPLPQTLILTLPFNILSLPIAMIDSLYIKLQTKPQNTSHF
jgi:hypothetical protein